MQVFFSYDQKLDMAGGLKGPKFPLQGRDITSNEKEGAPGPGRYYQENQPKIKGGVIGKEKRTFIGPGNPTQNGDHLGPGYYEEDYNFKIDQNKKNAKGPKIGSSEGNSKKRHVSVQKFNTPGPGSYDHRKDSTYGSVNGGTIPKTGRVSAQHKDKIPGPGQYGRNNQGGLSKTHGNGWSFGKEERGIQLKGNQVPGPGQYSKQTAKVRISPF